MEHGRMLESGEGMAGGGSEDLHVRLKRLGEEDPALRPWKESLEARLKGAASTHATASTTTAFFGSRRYFSPRTTTYASMRPPYASTHATASTTTAFFGSRRYFSYRTTPYASMPPPYAPTHATASTTTATPAPALFPSYYLLPTPQRASMLPLDASLTAYAPPLLSAPRPHRSDCSTALHDAAGRNDAATVRALLASGFIKVDAADTFGRTPLHWAARCGKAEALRELLKQGARATLRDTEGRTALHYAAQRKDAAAVRALLADGRIAVDAADNLGRTPLHLGAHRGSDDAVRELLAHGANVTLRDKLSCTTLHFAAMGNAATAVSVLLADARIAVDVADAIGRTPLHWAAKCGSGDALKELLKHGADVTLRDRKGCTALQIACERGNEDCARQLREAGGGE